MAEKTEFLAFYQAHVERIYKFVYFRVGGRREVAEDLVQDIFMKAFEAFERYDVQKSVSAWIFTIARNTVINYHAKRKADVTLEEIESAPIVSADARKEELLRDDERHLLDALAKLDSEEARLIRMKHLEGWSYEDLAEVFDKTPGTLRVQASRIVKKLRTLI
jgi:RNA polymerase sigma-70 factor (ECF subfamily)